MAIVPSTDYPAQTDVDSAYPHGKARNAGTFQDGTGTPLEKRWVNDLWGFLQSLLADAGITPSGDPDEVGASDYLDAVKLIALRDAKTALEPVRLSMRQIAVDVPFTDNSGGMAALRQSNGPVMLLKAGASDTHRVAENDLDFPNVAGTVASITTLVTDLAKDGPLMVAIGTGGNRCCFTTDFGDNWTAGSDLGATPERIIYNSTHSRFMVTFAAGVDVAQDADAASTWDLVSSGLTTAQGGIAQFSNGDVLVCGFDGGSAVEMAVSLDGGDSWAAAATVPNPGDYVDSGYIVGDAGTYIYHVGRVGTTELRICRTDSSLSWSLIATVFAPGTITFKPRILLCPDTGVLVIVHSLSSSSCAYVSRDGGFTWSDPAFWRLRLFNAIAIAAGRVYSTAFDSMYATDYLV